MNTFLATLVFLAGLSTSVEDSVAILYVQDESGGMGMRCTATAFDDQASKDAKKTVYLTASHCVTQEDKANPGKLKVTDQPLFLSTDKLDKKDYVRAHLVTVGRAEKGYDFAVLIADLRTPTIPLGDERQEGAHVQFVNIAAPLGIGKATFYGRVALKFIDRPLYDDDQDINWAGAMLVDVASEGGSSGSAAVSLDTGKIIGIIVGHYKSLKIAVPVSRIVNPPKDAILYPVASLVAIANASGSPAAK